ncbi:UDP-2,3-diacylglucosamine diphosphatase LpxI [Methylobacterium sp. E-016]|uniref:LpxI family protein n=1 Tax=Methylobacterium sp. E-016 TaxID=2836556 RepID=UPI001FBBEBBD|nr:UDP-2,3-diacylglucosamine diphosphatase LpxI [Methylobacterium sp. E-016]MCJ2075517.1 UDP-2,3-diacylglucosamine diphosphatase LpxI [Methylobacterium sp. E-016]
MSAPRPARPDARLVLVAGAGRLPEQVAHSLDRAGRAFKVLALRGFTDRPLRARADATVDLLDIGETLRILAGWGPATIVPAGGVARPSPAAILNAAAAFRNRVALRNLADGGDDRLLRGALALLEENGHTVCGVHEVAPDLLSPAGPIGRHAPDAAGAASIDTGRALLTALSAFDVGQAVVVAADRVLAVEGPEGTDRMLARARTVGRKPWDLRLWRRERALPATVLVKCAKDDQDLRIDLPAIGPRTVRNASAAGCVGLAVEAGRTLLIDRAETIAEADRLGLFLIGIGVGA